LRRRNHQLAVPAKSTIFSLLMKSLSSRCSNALWRQNIRNLITKRWREALVSEPQIWNLYVADVKTEESIFCHTKPMHTY
jgi:hypothetical protein